MLDSRLDTRARILAEAESMFRQYGYTKTTVADIARRCGMSPANVYRFFASKSAINEAICRDQLAECEAMARRIARRDEPAEARLRAFVLEVHRTHRDRFTEERKLHEMVVVAMEENWEVIDAYKATLRSILARIIAEGMETGRFAPADAEARGRVAFNALTKVFHPGLIAQCAHEDLDAQARELADLLIAALKTQPDG